jgi:hypothetical protein
MHQCEILKEEFLDAMGITEFRLSKETFSLKPELAKL